MTEPTVVVNKSAAPASGSVVKAGDVIAYTLTVVVSQAATRDAAVLTDTLGAGLEFGAVTNNAGGFVLGGSGRTRTFTLPAGSKVATYTVTYTAQVKADAVKDTLSNQVKPHWQTTPGIQHPPGIGDLSCGTCGTSHTVDASKVTAKKTTTAKNVRDGDEMDFEVEVTVANAATTEDVEIADTMDSVLAYVPGSDKNTSGRLGLAVVSGDRLQITLLKGTTPGTYRLQYRAKFTQNQTTAVSSVKNTITGNFTNISVCAALPDCTTTTPVVQSVVKYSKKVDKTGPLKIGDVLTYTVEVEVKDAKTTEALTVTDTLASGAEYVNPTPATVIKSSTFPALTPVTVTSVSNSGGPGASTLVVNIPKDIGPVSPQTLVTYQFSYQVVVTKEAKEWVQNAVSVTTPTGPAPSCANSCATKTPVAEPVIKMSKTSPTAGPVRKGNLIDFVVTVKVENSALPSFHSQMVDNLGPGLVFGGAVPSFPAGWSALVLGNKTLGIVIPAGTVPGTYQITYQAEVTADAVGMVRNQVNGSPTTGGVTPGCESAAACVVEIKVIREIDAVDDDYTTNPVLGSTGSQYVGNAYVNDKLNGLPVTLSSIVGKVDKSEVCTAAGCQISSMPMPELDPATGNVSVPPGTPQGDYLIHYTICDRLDAALCDSAVIKVKVDATITAKDDGVYTAQRGSGAEQVMGNAYDNDTLDKLPFTPDLVTTTVTPYNPAGKVPGLETATGKVRVPPGTPAGEYKIPYRICDRLNPTNCANAVITVIVKDDPSLLRIVKSAAVRLVKIGDLVRYTLKVENVGSVNVVNATIVDTAAPGFTYVAGSVQSAGLGSQVAASGVRPVSFEGISLEVGQSGTLVYLTRVGAGVQPGALVNRALARNVLDETISNVATATVQLTDDPLLDHSLIFGTVFDDRDGDGWQDSAAITGLTAQGGFAPGAYVPNSTTLNRGNGAKPVADASAPLLHGMALGEIAARQSDADPVEKHQLVIRQKLSQLDFTDDFVLANDQGVTVRMDAAGKTSVETSGAAAAGRNAAALEVERRVSPADGGHYVDYVVRSVGVDERGIPGVRIAAVEGLLMETDPFGRYHLVDIHGGSWERGRNFILKVDPSTLPAGAVFTTSNPLLRRITPGLPVRFDFGVKLQPQRIESGQQFVEIELGTVLFAPGASQVQAQYLPVMAQVADKVKYYGGGELLVQANGEGEAIAFARADAVRQAVAQTLPAEVLAKTRVSVRTQVDTADGLVSGVTADGAVLGTVLFETDKAVVLPAYQDLLAQVAAYLNRQGGGVVSLIGHTDVRASHDYNQKLGQRRAQAVHDALLPYLSPEVKQGIRVEAPTGAGHAKTAAEADAGGVKPVPSK